MARGKRGRGSGLRTVQVFQQARRAGRKGGKRAFARKFGGGLMSQVETSLGRGMLYGGVASKIIPGIAPLATLYGEYSGGGLEGLAINEFLVKPFIGLPSQLPNVLGNLGNLGNLFSGNAQPGVMSSGMMQAV